MQNFTAHGFLTPFPAPAIQEDQNQKPPQWLRDALRLIFQQGAEVWALPDEAVI